MPEIIHNPDRYMSDLRQVLSQGRKRIGFLVGAGAPTAIKVSPGTGELDPNGEPLIPDVRRLTTIVVDELEAEHGQLLTWLMGDIRASSKPGTEPNIEMLLSRVRLLSLAIGKAKVYDLDSDGCKSFASKVASCIGKHVAKALPKTATPYTEIVGWIAGTNREYPIEIFTPNYDLLFEEAFERACVPYFDGFSGGHAPFFDPPTVANDTLPARWSRIWKIHGSLGWEIRDDRIVRTGARGATELIYPDHLKYDKIERMPYSALFERLRCFLKTPDSLLLVTGFSFSDAHISSVIEESLAANPHSAVFAFQYRPLVDEELAAQLAKKRANFSLYAEDGAVISGVPGKWQPGQDLTKDWPEIRNTYWGTREGTDYPGLLLGDFAHLARFCAMAQAVKISSQAQPSLAEPITQATPDQAK